MSWEDCGFKPGKIYGPEKCAKGACGDCDGAHHFYVMCGDGPCADEDDEPMELPEGLDPSMFFACKHCDVKAEAIDEE